MFIFTIGIVFNVEQQHFLCSSVFIRTHQYSSEPTELLARFQHTLPPLAHVAFDVVVTSDLWRMLFLYVLRILLAQGVEAAPRSRLD